jgi:hypothetical protein
MIPNLWKYAFASVLGTSHRSANKACEDVSRCRVIWSGDNSPTLVAVVSDGAGSASHSREGAHLACSHVIEEVFQLVNTGCGPRDLSLELAQNWCVAYRNEIERIAIPRGLGVRDFACTLVAAIVGQDSATFIQLGDGATVVARRQEPDQYQWVFWPQRGEFENTTYFLTDPLAPEFIQVDFVQDTLDEVALLTDGLQRLALHYQTQTAHADFFLPIFKYVRALPAGYSAEATETLKVWLDSPQVNERTDDDKSLVLASRRNSPVDPAS